MSIRFFPVAAALSAIVLIGAHPKARADEENVVIPSADSFLADDGFEGFDPPLPVEDGFDSEDLMGGHGGGHGGGGHGGGGHGGGGHGGGGHGGGGHGGGGHGGGGHGGGGHGGGYRGGDGHGHIGQPARFRLGREPRGGWRGHRYIWGGRPYYVWAWGPWAPWYNWGYYYGWRIGLGYYIPDGIRCIADNTLVAGEWISPTMYYSSDDAINSALELCENDPYVLNAGASSACRIRTCVRW